MESSELKVFEEMSKKNYKRWLVPFVDDLLERTNFKKGKILDVACGPGFLVKELANRSKLFELVGIDYSKYAVRQAKKNCKQFRNTSFKVASVYQIPFSDNYFDALVSKDSLHHFDNLKMALVEMLRVLKPGGVLYAQDLRRDLPWYLLKRSIPQDSMIKKLQFYSARASYTKEEVKKIFFQLEIDKLNVKTRKMTKRLKIKYTREGIDPGEVKESFQSRYVIMANKMRHV